MKDFYNNLSDELKMKIKACQNDDELKSLLAAEKIELDAEMMGAVSGGSLRGREECPTVFRDSLVSQTFDGKNFDGSCKDYVCKRFIR